MNSLATNESIGDPSDRILGKRRLALFERLREERTVLQLTLIGRNYERLSLVNGLKREGGGVYVLLDCPQGFTESIPDCEGVRVKVEFLDKDKIMYAFRSHISASSKEDIWVVVPEFVERIQRRRHFRIAPPMGTGISFNRGGKWVEAPVVNLSEGGSLICLTNEPSQKDLRLWKGEEIRNLRVRCREGRVRTNLEVKKTLVIREEQNTQTGRPCYALQFLEMETKDKNALCEFIFNCQRDMLRRRRELDGDVE